MESTQEKLTQLLSNEQIENWQLAWELVQGNQALLPILEQTFLQRFANEDTSFCFMLAKQIPQLNPLLAKGTQSRIVDKRWRQELDYGTAYETIYFDEGGTGLMLCYNLEDIDETTQEYIFNRYELFRYQLYYNEAKDYLYMKMTNQEAFEYSIYEDTPSPCSRVYTNGEHAVNLEFGDSTTFTIYNNFFDSGDYCLTLEYHNATLSKDLIPDFKEWKEENPDRFYDE